MLWELKTVYSSESPVNTSYNPFFECKYCLKKIVKKATFDKHNCETKKRYALCKTRLGFAAFDDYKYWISLKKGKVINLSTFVGSTYFNSFIEFQDLAMNRGLPDRKLFMQVAVDRGLLPNIWKSDEMYEYYIAHYDGTVTPMVKFINSVRTLSSIADSVDCDISEALNHMLPSEIALLIFQRRLSPWLLLLSPKFMHILHTVKDDSQFVMLNALLDPVEAKKQFRANKSVVEEIKKMVKELNL